MQAIDLRLRHALYDVQATRDIEHAAQTRLPPHTLMQRAGLAVAQLALALAPHGQRVWLACGPGNNGGDGLEAAMHLQRWGKTPLVTWLGQPEHAPPDARASQQRAQQAGVTFCDAPPLDCDVCIDALLGIGAQSRPPEGRMADWIAQMNAGRAAVLAVDLPSGLHANTGVLATGGVQAQHTLSLLTLKPGLFTADGRDAAGRVWLADLDASESINDVAPSAYLSGAPQIAARRHASHKGSYGDVAVIGGAPGMTGAALLAASGALHAGAGRVFVGLLDGGSMSVDTQQPELMLRDVNTLDFSALVLVCGCGGGHAVRAPLLKLLRSQSVAVIDADALNLIANEVELQTLLSARGQRLGATVLTPHPLEAARLLGLSVAQVQNDRIGAAGELAQRFNCTVVLKGSGTLIAAPGQTPVINASGNARLATAGSGDVLAGMIGAQLAAGLSAFDAACHAVYQHGFIADHWPMGQTLTATALARSL